MFCCARKNTLVLEDQVNKKFINLEAEKFKETIEPAGVINASPVILHRIKNGSS